MRGAAIFVCTAGVVMAAALVYGFVAGGGWDEVRVLMDYPWFVVSLFDVYVGFALFSGWILYRERPLPALIWIILLLTLGNLIACVYALLSLVRARGCWTAFWLGRRRASAMT